MNDQDERLMLLRQIDELGEDQVRLRLKGLEYDIVQKRFLQAEFERRDRIRNNEAEQRAERLAHSSNRIAVIALVVAVIALSAQFVQLLV